MKYLTIISLIIICIFALEFSYPGSVHNLKSPLDQKVILNYNLKNLSVDKQGRKGPVIRFKQTIYDFGSVSPNEEVKANFVFYNKGDGPLLLKDVQAACGCTVPKWARKPVMPGDSSVINAVFSPKDYAGQSVNKAITVLTYIKENGQDKIITLYIRGNVLKNK